MFNNIVQNYAFNVSKEFKQVRHYLSEKKLENALLTSTINISKDREFNKSKKVSYWLKIREPKKWSKNITGLKTTIRPNVFYGDIPTIKNGVHKPKHLLIFIFNYDKTKVSIDLYKDFYPKNNKDLIRILSKY